MTCTNILAELNNAIQLSTKFKVELDRISNIRQIRLLTDIDDDNSFTKYTIEFDKVMQKYTTAEILILCVLLLNNKDLEGFFDESCSDIHPKYWLEEKLIEAKI
jgi:hypothetical protein